MCSIYGTSISDPVLLTGLGIEGESRGKDATGVAWLIKNKLGLKKKDIKASDFAWGDLPGFAGEVDFYLGHTRATTQGNEHDNFNNHPFVSMKKDFVLAHNGVISNDKQLVQNWELPETKIKTDSYVALQLLELTKYMHKQDSLNIDIIKETCELLAGTFALSILTRQGKLFLLRHNRPLNITYNGKDIIYASTKEMIQEAGKFLEKDNETKLMNSFIGEIENDTIYEYNIFQNKFINTDTFTASIYTKPYSYPKKEYYQETANEDYKGFLEHKKDEPELAKEEQSDYILTYDEFVSLSSKEKEKYEMCDGCGGFYALGMGGYSSDTGSFLCYECDEYKYENLTDEEIEKIYLEILEEERSKCDGDKI